MNVLKAALKFLRNLIERGATIAVLAFGAVMVVRGETQVGVIVAFLSALRQIQGPWGELLDFYRRLADARIKYMLVRQAIIGAPAAGSPTAIDDARAAAVG